MAEVKSLRILIFTAYFWPENFRINELALDLAEAGHVVNVVTGYPNYPSGKIYPNFKMDKKSFQTFGMVTITRIPCLPRGSSKISLVLNYISYFVNATFWVVFKGYKKSADAVFVYAPSPITVTIPAILFKKFYSRPIVLWVLDLWPETLEAFHVVKGKLVLRFLDKIVGWIYKNFDYIFGQSVSFVENIVSKGVCSSKVGFLGSWSDEHSYTPPIKKFGHLENRDVFTITFAGNIGVAQDIPSIVDAAQLLRSEKNIRFLIVGDGSQLQYLKEQIAIRNLESKFLLTGQLPAEAMPEVHSYSDALLVCLQKAEIFSYTIPGKLQSCLFAGKPILGMLDGDGAAVIEDSKSGLIASAGDAVTLSQNIIKMSKMKKSKLRAYGVNGKTFYEKRFSRKRAISAVEKKLTEITKRL